MKPLWSLLCLLVWQAFLHKSTAEARPGKDFALFFANEDYRDNPDFDSLKNPIKDARAVARELETMYGFEVEIHENLGKAAIFEVLGQWQKRDFPNDGQLFIFFSGHGAFWEFTKKGYFVPKGNRNDYSAYIELTDLGNIITQIPCRHILVAIDACYSGTIDREIAFRGGPGFGRSGSGAGAERKKVIDRQLRNKSRLLLTSGGKERTPDGVDHSPFTAAILRSLRTAYTSGDGLVTYKDIESGLERVSPTPHYGELPGHEDGGFVFATVEARQEPPGYVSESSQLKKQEPEYTAPVFEEERLSPASRLAFVRGGVFLLGEQPGEEDNFEAPVRSVAVGDFLIGRYEVTFEEYDAFCRATRRPKPADRGWGRGSRPAINVNWFDAAAFCNWKSKEEGLDTCYQIRGKSVAVNFDANGYRLPTEAEWEYAAKEGRIGGGNLYSGSSLMEEAGWYAANAGRKTQEIGRKNPNRLQLFDMSGNVAEWCNDWYSENSRQVSSGEEYRGPDRGTLRVVKGGSWDDLEGRCAVSFREAAAPESSSDKIGFRYLRKP